MRGSRLRSRSNRGPAGVRRLFWALTVGGFVGLMGGAGVEFQNHLQR